MIKGEIMLRSLCIVVCLSLFVAAQPAQATDLSGCWSGSWGSCTSRHRGPLNATFTRCNEQQYEVTFSGRFFKIMPFRYSVTLDVTEDCDVVKLSGSSYLGRLMGTFNYRAQATECHFSSSYSSCKDHGWFELSRCSSGNSCCQ